MRIKSNPLIALMLLFVVLSMQSPQASDLELPTKTPDLNVTDAAALGTLEESIGLPVGSLVMDFETTTHDGKPVKWSEAIAEGPLLIIFYRGGWCPYCNLQIRQVTAAWPEFEKRGVTPVLISVDQTDGAALAQRTYEIPFPVWSDPTLAAHEAFSVVLDLDRITTTKYKAFGIDLEAWSGRSDGKIAVSSAFLIDAEGLVRWSHADTDYRTRPSVNQFLSIIDTQYND